MSYLGYSSNLAPVHCRFGVLYWILIKYDTRASQFRCLMLDIYQMRHPCIADLVSFLGYSSNLAPARCRFAIYSVYSSNLAPTHCKIGVLFWILIKSGTRALQIWCLILDIYQIWHPRIADLVSFSGYSINMAPTHCRFCVLIWIQIKSVTAQCNEIGYLCAKLIECSNL